MTNHVETSEITPDQTRSQGSAWVEYKDDSAMNLLVWDLVCDNPATIFPSSQGFIYRIN